MGCVLPPPQEDHSPTGHPLARYYHKPTAQAPPDRPHFTVIIPTFHNMEGLHKAVASVYAQVGSTLKPTLEVHSGRLRV